MNNATALRRRMAELTGTQVEDWYLVAKARQGMQVALRAAGIETGRKEVLTQLFTCVTAVDPILTAGLVPRYVDISPNTLRIDSAYTGAGQNTCAVVLQNTFGIMDETSAVALRDTARACGAMLLEDSAHCVSRLACDGLGVPVADVSVHSFGVEKILPGVYFGGAVWVNPAMANTALRQRICNELASLPSVDKKLDIAARSYRNQLRVLTRLPHGASQALRSRWERIGALEPAVSEVERRGGTNHAPSKPSEWMCEQALAALEGLESNTKNRLACVGAYREAFDEGDVQKLRIPTAVLAGAAQPLLRYPVFMQSKDHAVAAAKAVSELGFYVPDWPRPLLVPGVLDLAPYGLAQGTDAWPVSQRLSSGIVALPTDIQPAQVPSVVESVLVTMR